MAILDRSNLGNAQIAGMPEAIGLVGNQFGTATTLLYYPILLASYCDVSNGDVDMLLMFPSKPRFRC